MRFAFLNAGLIVYAKNMSIKSKFYTENMKHPKNRSALLFKKKIKKQEAKVEK